MREREREREKERERERERERGGGGREGRFRKTLDERYWQGVKEIKKKL